MKDKTMGLILTILLLCLLASPAWAQEAEPVARVRVNGGAVVDYYVDIAEAWSEAAGAAEAKIWLFKDWTASGGSFGTGTGFGAAGNLLVPGGANVSLYLNGHTIDRKLTSEMDGGNVITVQGALTVSDVGGAGAITGGYEKGYGGGIVVSGGALTLRGGAIQNNKAYRAAGVYVHSGGSFTMWGGSVAQNAADNFGGGVYVVDQGSTLTLQGGAIRGNTAQCGGGVLLYTGAKFTMEGGRITENSLTTGNGRNGGGVNAEYATMTMTGGEISNNTIIGGNNQSGGGVFLRQATLTMTGGEIYGNRVAGGGTQSINGGGVAFNSGTFSMSGGSIRRNFAPTGCGVYVAHISGESATFTLSGSATVADHTDTNGVNSNIYAADAEDVVIGNLTSGAAVYISTPEDAHHGSGKQIAKAGTGFTDAALAYLFFDGPSGTRIYGAKQGAGDEILCGDVIGDRFTVAWGASDQETYGTLAAAFADIDDRGESCTVTMHAGATVDQAVAITNGYTVTLKADGAGMRLTRGNTAEPLISVTGGATLNLENITLDGNRGDTPTGSLIAVDTDSTLQLYEGATLTNNYAAQGGAVNVVGGWFGLREGAVIERCKASGNGGGVYYGANAQYHAAMLIEGTIRDCEAGGSGGGFYNESNEAPVVMAGAHFIRNTASKHGGGLYAEWTETLLSTIMGTYTSNTASGDGGGLYLKPPVSVSLEATVSHNEAYNGGGAYVSGSATILDDCKLSNNRAKASGGGLYAASGELNEQSVVQDNEARDGGGVYATGDFTTAGEISGNTATGNGGGVYANVISVTGGSVNNNSAGGGGGAYAEGTLQIGGQYTNATLSGNAAGGMGGGAYAAGKLVLYNASVTGNTAGVGVGGVYWTGHDSLEIDYAATLQNNTLQGVTPANLYLPEGSVIDLPGTLTGTVGVTLGGSPTYNTPVVVGNTKISTNAERVRLDVQPSDKIIEVMYNATEKTIVFQKQTGEGKTVFVYKNDVFDNAYDTLENALAALPTMKPTSPVVYRLNVLTIQALKNPLQIKSNQNVVITGEGASPSVEIKQASSFHKSNFMIAIEDKGSLTLEHITVKGSTGAENGMIDVQIGGSLTLGKGAVLTGNQNVDTVKGGAIQNNGSTTLQDGCQITDCKALEGGAIYSTGTLTIGDARIGGNESANGNPTGAVHIMDGGTLLLSGAPVISGNDNGGTDKENRNVYLPQGTMIGANGLKNGANVGVRSANSPSQSMQITITHEHDGDLSGLFTADEYGCAVIRDSDFRVEKLAISTIKTHPADAFAREGESASFTVEGRDPTAAYAFLWQQKTTATTYFYDITGATEATYTLPAAEIGEDGYQYRCIVTDTNNPSLSELSKSATLTVIPLPDPDPDPDPVYYTVTVQDGSGSGRYTAGTTVPVEAATPDGARFDQWVVVSGGAKLADAASEKTSFVMPANPVEIRATFVYPVTKIAMIEGRAMTVGEAGYLSLTLEPASARKRHLTWQSDDPAVASVDESGLVTAKAPGVAAITATSRWDATVTASCEVTVRAADEHDTPLRALTVGKGKKIDLKALFGDIYAWSSDDPGIAAVNAKDMLRGVSAGSTVVRGTLGGMTPKSALIGDVIELHITVVKQNAAVSKLKLSPAALSLKPGERAAITAKLTPAGAADKTILWASDDPAVAVVDASGAVTGVGAGETVIRATASSGIQKTVAVTVAGGGTAPDAPEATALTLSPNKRTQAVGETFALSLILTPANADRRGVVWMCGDPAVATVENGVVTGVSVGETEITATLGDLTARCRVQIVSEDAPERALALNANFLAVAVNRTIKLKDLAGFKGAWTSADPAVASITKKGKLKTKAEGETTLTFAVGTVVKRNARFMEKALVAGDSVAIRLIVVPKGHAVKRISLAGEATLAPGDTRALSAIITPAKATHKDVFWRSDDPAVATVDETGTVTAVATGCATITATATSGVSAKCAITVK